MEEGHSGSPVIDASSDQVFAVAIQIRRSAGLAISIENLRKIWPDMPPGLIMERKYPPLSSGKPKFPDHCPSPWFMDWRRQLRRLAELIEKRYERQMETSLEPGSTPEQKGPNRVKPVFCILGGFEAHHHFIDVVRVHFWQKYIEPRCPALSFLLAFGFVLHLEILQFLLGFCLKFLWFPCKSCG